MLRTILKFRNAALALLVLSGALPARAEEGPKLDLEGLDDPASHAQPAPAAEAQQPAGQGTADAQQSFEQRTSPFATLSQKTASILHRTTLGGYGEHHLIVGGEGERSTFAARRYVLFVYSQITERITTATELELEFAGSPLKRDGQYFPGEVVLEFSVVDFKVTDWLKLRAGVILMPFGALNTRHDAPSQELTDRPIAYTSVVPSTWFESGAGALGTIELGGDHQLSYELYAVNGLDARIFDGQGLQGAKGSHLLDNNDDKAIVGRLSYSPFLGLEVGVSGYTGKYGQSDARVNMGNVDVTWRLGRFELLAEGVLAQIDPGVVDGFSKGSPANTFDEIPPGMRGFYLQGAYRFPMPFARFLPEDLKGSQLAAILRYEEKDTNTQFVTQLGDEQRATLGLNFRPTPAYVIKTDLQLGSRGERWSTLAPRFVSSVAFLF